MTTINIDCSQCRENLSLPAEAMLATAAAGDDTDIAGVVCWICDGCEDVVSAQLRWPEFLRLIRAGVPLMEEDLEVELPPHPEHPREGLAITPDDLLELHELLATDTWFSALAALRA
jgi:hypothetical protein